MVKTLPIAVVNQQASDVYEKLEEYCNKLREEVLLNNRILLVKGIQCSPETFEMDIIKNRCYYAYPPIGLQCLAQSIKEIGLEAKILDLNFEFLKRTISDYSFNPNDWLKILDNELEKFDPAFVGVSNLFSADTPPFIQIMEHVINNKNRKRIVLAGGQNATYDSKGLLRDNLCHFVCKYEAENKINYVLETMLGKNPKKTSPTAGIIFKHDEAILETDGLKDEVILKGNLIETYDLIEIEEYCKVGTISPYSRMSGKDKPYATVLFNRGCHGGCIFCGVPEFSGRKVRSKPSEDLLDELEFLIKEKGVKHFEFLDDDLAVYKDKFADLLKGIKERNFNITWASSNGIIASCLNEELMQLMRETNCLGFKIGVESGDEVILRKVKKPGTIPKFREFSKLAQKFPEMFIADNYIFGLPEETFSSIMKSYRFSLEMKLDWSCYSVYQPNVSYFGDRKEGDSNFIGDFIPAKEARKGKLISNEPVEGIEVFKYPPDLLPNVEQVKQMWFTFNLVRNFILNKNLTPEGNIKKYLDWTEAVQERYPTNPKMSFFVSLANYLNGDYKKGELHHKKTLENLNNDSYWQKKFEQFKLKEIIKDFPQNTSHAEQALKFLRDEYLKY